MVMNCAVIASIYGSSPFQPSDESIVIMANTVVSKTINRGSNPRRLAKGEF